MLEFLVQGQAIYRREKAIYRDYHVGVLSSETRNGVGIARIAEPVRHVSDRA